MRASDERALLLALMSDAFSMAPLSPRDTRGQDLCRIYSMDPIQSPIQCDSTRSHPNAPEFDASAPALDRTCPDESYKLNAISSFAR